MKIVMVLSGGMDSTILLHDLIDAGHEITSCVSFNYGQNHKKELDYAVATCQKLGIKFHLIDLWTSGFTGALGTSTALTQGASEVPEGHYAEDTMKATVVPNRNMVMLSIAGSIAVAEGANSVATAVHAGDHFVYPDCRPMFVLAASQALYEGNKGMSEFEEAVLAPYMYLSKADIAHRGLELGVNFSETWSCYKGGMTHCGRCGTCVERLEAIDEASIRYNSAAYLEQGAFDDTEYEDNEFWREATNKEKN